MQDIQGIDGVGAVLPVEMLLVWLSQCMREGGFYLKMPLIESLKRASAVGS